jgi:phosphoribosylformylglycinamidine cyclo-ligase
MQWVQAQGAIETDEMHRVFNCGIGMVVVVAADQAEAVAAHLTAQGERVFQIGQVRARQSGEDQTLII